MNDHEACIILNLLIGLGGLSAWKKNRGLYINKLIDAIGNASSVFELDAATLCRAEGIRAEHADLICRWREFVDLDRELKTAEDEGVTILCRSDTGYPSSLRKLANPPLCLYVRGRLPSGIAGRSVAIVGTRTPSDSGVRMARRFSEAASRDGWSHGWITVSGLALGIDTAAHLASVEAGGRTVAVLGSGMNKLYPPENLELARAIVRTGGAVVSEYPMNTQTTRSTLARRNRIIAGLARCTLVIEAGAKSGALITATTAQELGCRVFAVPGDEGNPLAAGCNKLIRQGATPVTQFESIFAEIMIKA